MHASLYNSLFSDVHRRCQVWCLNMRVVQLRRKLFILHTVDASIGRAWYRLLSTDVYNLRVKLWLLQIASHWSYASVTLLFDAVSSLQLAHRADKLFDCDSCCCCRCSVRDIRRKSAVAAWMYQFCRPHACRRSSF
jgi:hypothetical protein